MDHGCSNTRARWLAREVDDLLHIHRQLWVLLGELVFDLMDHPLVRVVLGLNQPEVIEGNIITSLPTKHVEALFDVEALGNLLSCVRAFMDPHAPAVLIPVNEADIAFRADGDALIYLSVAIGIVREYGDEAMALARTDCLQPRCITVLCLDRRAILCL